MIKRTYNICKKSRSTRSEKGSQYWMHKIVNNEDLCAKLNKQIGDDLEWLSPLQKGGLTKVKCFI